MKKLIIAFLLFASFQSFGQLTIDQKATILASPTFHNRVKQVLLEKAQYWRNTTTPNRADVNRQIQKRKRFSNVLLSDQNAAINYEGTASIFWISVTSTATLDGNGIPTATAISDAFDPTYDYLAGVISGDSSNTEIDW